MNTNLNGASDPGPQAILEAAAEGPQSEEVHSASTFESIPTELKNLRQWVAWREEPRDGRTTKPPINPATGHLASPTDPKDWGTFDEAIAAMKGFHLDGIGFVWTAETGIVAIDLDNCRDPETGELTSMAERIVMRCDSYTEVSPSGRGVHIFVRGELPVDGRRSDGMEIYRANRYFTMTGNEFTPNVPVLLSSAIESRQDAIDAIYSWIAKDAEIVAKAREEKPEFEALWNGEMSAYQGDESRADLALCNMLVPRCNRDPKQMDRIFRWSGLMRSKWDEKRGARTYGEVTINGALADRPPLKERENVQPASPRIYSLSEILETDFPMPAPVVEGLMAEGDTVLLIGKPKIGKSRLTQQLTLSLSRGEAFLKRDIPVPRRVLYLDLENRLSGVKARFAQMGGESSADSRIFIYAPETLAENAFVATREGMSALSQAVQSFEPEVLVIDPWRLFVGGDGNKEDVVMAGLKTLSQLRQQHPKLAILLVHHLRKQSDNFRVKLRHDPYSWVECASGHYSLVGHTDSIFGLERELDHDGELIVFGGVMRNEPAPILMLDEDEDTLRFDVSQGEEAAITSFTQLEMRLWEVARGLREFTYGKLVEASGTKNKKAVSAMLRKAQDAGVLSHEGKLYHVATFGAQSSGPSTADRSPKYHLFLKVVFDGWNPGETFAISDVVARVADSGISRDHANQWLGELVASGAVARIGEGQYRVAGNGTNGTNPFVQ